MNYDTKMNLEGEIMKKVLNALKEKKFWGVVNSLALLMVVANFQQCCYWFLHQPKLPEEAEKYRKFK